MSKSRLWEVSYQATRPPRTLRTTVRTTVRAFSQEEADEIGQRSLRAEGWNLVERNSVTKHYAKR